MWELFDETFKILREDEKRMIVVRVFIETETGELKLYSKQAATKAGTNTILEKLNRKEKKSVLNKTC